MSTRAVERWTLEPLRRFVRESRARLVLLLTTSGQVLAQHGFARAVDVMAAAALASGIVASTDEIAKLLRQGHFGVLSHQGTRHGIYLSPCSTQRGRLLVLVVYGQETSLGLVSLFYDQLAVDLTAAAPRPPEARPVLAADFERDLNESLAQLFGE